MSVQSLVFFHNVFAKCIACFCSTDIMILRFDKTCKQDGEKKFLTVLRFVSYPNTLHDHLDLTNYSSGS